MAGAHSCPADDDRTSEVIFRYSNSPDVTVVVGASGCGYVQEAGRGHLPSTAFTDALAALAGAAQ